MTPLSPRVQDPVLSVYLRLFEIKSSKLTLPTKTILQEFNLQSQRSSLVGLDILSE